MTIKEEIYRKNSKYSKIVSRIEVRLTIADKNFRNEFEKFIDSQLSLIIERLIIKLGHQMPSISHDLVKSNDSYAIILSLTDGSRIASYAIDLLLSENCFLLKDSDKSYKLKSATALGAVLEKLFLNIFTKNIDYSQ